MGEISYLSLMVVLLPILVVQYLFVRREIRSLMDPLFYFVVATSFALTFSTLVVPDVSLTARLFGYFFNFWIGFFLIKKTSIVGAEPGMLLRADPAFKVVCVLGFLVYVMLNVYSWSVAGVPLFSDDPSLQKVETLTGGLGVVRRFNWGMGSFISVASLYWYMLKRSWTPLFCLIVFTVISIMSGSKSALLTILFGFGLYVRRPFLVDGNKNFIPEIKRYTGLIFLMALVPVGLVLSRENEGMAEALTSFATRLLYFGDSLLYWGDSQLRAHFHNRLGAGDYLGHMLNPILGVLRLVPYQVPIGSQFVQYSLSVGEELSESLGPNTPFYVKGELFFGPLAALLYSAVVGGLVGALRNSFVGMKEAGLTRYSMGATLAILVMTLPTEDSLFVGKLFDLIIVFVPLFCVSNIIYWASLRRIGYEPIG